MAFKVVLASTDVTQYVVRASGGTPPTVTSRQNERTTAQLTLRPPRGSEVGYFPSKFEPITIYDIDGTTPVFGGVVLSRSTEVYEQGMGSWPKMNLDCVDAMVYTDWAFWTKTYTTSQTLKQVMTDFIADKLAANGITLDATQDNGDTFAPFTVGNDGVGQKLSDFIRDLCARCNPPRVAKMSPSKALKIIVPGTETAPFNPTDASPRILTLDWRDGDFTPANLVKLICGPNGNGISTQSWTKHTGETSWEVDIQALVGGWQQGYVSEISGGTVNQTVSPPGEGGYYYWDDTTGKGTLSVGTGAAPADGTVIQFVYTAVYPFTVQATSGASPVIEVQYQDPNQLLLGPAQLEVNGLLTQLNQSPREATVVTLERGFATNQAITLKFVNHFQSVSTILFFISEVTATFTEFKDTATPGAAGRDMWHYTLILNEGTVAQGSYLSQAREMFGGSSSPATSVTSLQSGAIDVYAHRGGDDLTLMDFESLMSVYGNASMAGPAHFLGLQGTSYRWAIVANSLKGSTPGTVASLEFVAIPDGGAYRRAMTLTQADTPVAGEYYVVGSVPGKLSIGAASGVIGGFSGAASVEAVFSKKYYENRGQYNGEVIVPSAATAAALFGVDSGSITVDNADVADFWYSYISGKLLLISFDIRSATTASGPGYVKITLPGSHTLQSSRNMHDASVSLSFDNGTTIEEGKAVAFGSDSTFIRIYRFPGFAAYSNVTNNFNVQGSIIVPIN